MVVCAGIVLFNPDIERLLENLNHIRNQVSQLILVDNGSKNIGEIKKSILCEPKIVLIENNHNMGIAFALNQILEFAKANDYKWFLTLDQDSIANYNLISEYERFINDYEEKNLIGCLTCNIVDRNFDGHYQTKMHEEIDYCITSGSLMNLTNTVNINGYDNSMFIDKVDCDICINLRKHGYKIIRINYNGLLHEIGHAKQISLGFRKWELYNHNSFRRYYMCRNASYLLKKYHNGYVLKIFAKEIFQLVLVLIFECNRKEKLVKGISGFIDGFIK